MHPANYVLMMCVAMDDPGLIVMPTPPAVQSGWQGGRWGGS